jgi:hypothetical protein
VQEQNVTSLKDWLEGGARIEGTGNQFNVYNHAAFQAKRVWATNVNDKQRSWSTAQRKTLRQESLDQVRRVGPLWDG